LSIILSNNNLGAVKIAEYLEGYPPICHIDLDYNRFNDDDAILISQELRRNTNVRGVSLWNEGTTQLYLRQLKFERHFRILSPLARIHLSL
jgi:hypothetical protein